ncbi:hypothetical protein FRB93_013729 [Tulasnella sp. JGI-2019a]|nr:hypothetical protein FRB93_013729 [Tulasnella sp. JGI-2019a]
MAAPESTAKGMLINSNVASQWKLERSKKALKVERVLLRFVFEDVGENLAETRDATSSSAWLTTTWKLLLFTKLYHIAIRELWMVGILHRDISFGNLLVATGHPLRGFVTDLGLTMRVTENGKAQEGSDVHHHLTGTLKFIAASLLPEDGDPRPAHAVGHNIESLFWVLLWTCLAFSEMAQPTRWMTNTLNNLNGADAATVGSKKWVLLLNPHFIRIEGKYYGATAFLQAFANLCQFPKTRTFDAVTKIFDDFKHDRLDPPEDMAELEQPSSPTPGSSQLKRTLEDKCEDGPRSKRSKGG